MSAETTARASHRVAMIKMDSIEESSVPAWVRLLHTGCHHAADNPTATAVVTQESSAWPRQLYGGLHPHG